MNIKQVTVPFCKCLYSETYTNHKRYIQVHIGVWDTHTEVLLFVREELFWGKTLPLTTTLLELHNQAVVYLWDYDNRYDTDQED